MDEQISAVKLPANNVIRSDCAGHALPRSNCSNGERPGGDAITISTSPPCRGCWEAGLKHRQSRVDVRIVRIFNTYGPRMLADDGRVVSNFIVQALKGQDITVYGDGSQTRSFCFVDDLIDGMVRMMENEGFIGPVNLGNPREFTILELAKKIIAMTGSRSKIVQQPLPSNDPTQRQPHITLARQKLGWQAQVDVDEGFKVTMDYFGKELAR